MKKWTVALLSAILVLGITACGNDKGATGSTTTDNKPAATETQQQPAAALPTADELITKTVEAGKTSKNFAMEGTIKQNITVGEGDQKQEQKVEISLKSEITKEPMHLYQEMKMSIAGQEQNIKQYIAKEGMFVEVDGAWVKLPKDAEAELLAQVQGQISPEQQFEAFRSAAKDMKVTEEGDQYVMNADLSGDGMKEMVKKVMSQSASGKDPQTLAMIEQMNIKSVKLSFAVNKETFLPTKSDMVMDLTMEEGGQKMSLVMDMKSTFSKHNEIGEIKVPQEVIDSAKQ
ncbi:DUF6612 family protein [Paenibacillus agilis]|uniref:LppX_LprAFG lipoprotein n=1 Tax=Paenibacillus agilis TaxID=3020863 RepID=A0A559IGN5_9BACL|nr:DUF6612 family protein [Paenibacillus agilis]TVX86818.1 hypothetical protein FPZ44_23155 [Paenibacillus agilis]